MGEEFGIWWQEDSATDVCNVCDKEFALLRRRHHCRFCGDVVCAACTNSKALHPKSNTLEYICRTCAAELARMIDEIIRRREGMFYVPPQTSRPHATTSPTTMSQGSLCLGH